jgi:hypothetical protein
MATQQRWSRDEIVIELANTRKRTIKKLGVPEEYGPVNTQFFCKLFKAVLRGKWSSVGLTGQTSALNLTSMPEIPGIHIAVDLKRKRIRALDPLAWAEHEETLARANAIRSFITGYEGRPWDDMVISNATDTEIKTALWEMANWVKAKKANVIAGHLPPPEKVLELDGGLIVRTEDMRTGERDAEGNAVLTPYATENELAKMGKPPEERVLTVPAGTS